MQSGFAYKLVRWPFLGVVGFIVLLELFMYIAIRWLVLAIELSVTPKRRKLKRLRDAAHNAQDYVSWKQYAEKIDEYLGKKVWKEAVDTINPLYDQHTIGAVTEQIQKFSKALAESSSDQGATNLLSNARKLMTALEVACKSNLGGIENERLYSYTYVGTKVKVQHFYDEVEKALYLVSEATIPNEEKAAFFKRISKEYGQTALCLSGGASFGYYHMGVILSLLELDLLPRVVAGTSAGSLMAALLCIRTNDELKEILNPSLANHIKTHNGSTFALLKRLFTEGVLFDVKEWIENIQWVTMGDTTFLEAYQRTGRILNISAVPQERHSPPKLLNYLNAPNVVIYSAIIASAAVPGLVNPVELLYKTEEGTLMPYHHIGERWRDGSLKTDIPTATLHSLFNVNYTIVSQVNPHIFPFFFHNRGAGGAPSPHRQGTGWRGGFLMSTLERYLKLDLVKWLRFLRDLDLLPTVLGQDWSFVFLQKFEGTVTVTPRLHIPDYFRLISDPDEKRMKRYIEGGRRMTWPKLTMIENRMKTEKAIQICKNKVCAKPKRATSS